MARKPSSQQRPKLKAITIKQKNVSSARFVVEKGKLIAVLTLSDVSFDIVIVL